MRITFLMPADDLTGGNRVVGTYARRLNDRGHEVLVVCNAPDRPPLRERVRASLEQHGGIDDQACARLLSLLGYVDEPELIHRDNLVLL